MNDADSQRRRSGDSLKIGFGPAWLQATGSMTMIMVLFLCLASINVGMVLYHHWGIAGLHQAMINGLDNMTEAQHVTNYLKTLNEEQSQSLCLDVPKSIRAHVLNNGKGRLLKQC